MMPEKPARSATKGKKAQKKHRDLTSVPQRERELTEQATLAPETLARTLRAVAAELERDPDLARRISSAITTPTNASEAAKTALADGEVDTPSQASPSSTPFRPRLITGTSPDLGPGIPDPFALYQQRGESGLREVLDGLRLGTLRAIIREQRLDSQGKVSRQNDADKLRALILSAVVPTPSPSPSRGGGTQWVAGGRDTPGKGNG